MRKRIALLFSLLVVGMGQVYLEKSNKGLILCLAFYLGIPFFLLFFLNFASYLFPAALGTALVAGLGLWGYGVWDTLKN
jgi:TM2 domain-containing membrane protein YozV